MLPPWTPLPIGNCHAREPEMRPGSMGLPTENYRRTADLRREFFKGPHPTATRVIVHGLLPRRRDRDLGRGGAARLKLPI